MYAQDSWKVSRRLTVELGFRGYLIQPQYDAALQTSNFLPQLYVPGKSPLLFQPGRAADGKTRIAVNPLNPAQTLPGSAIGDIVNGSGDLLNGIRLAGHGINKYLMEYRGLAPAPRFGFAYDVGGKQTLVVRGGFGI